MIFLNGKQIGRLDIKPKDEQTNNNNVDLDIYKAKRFYIGEQQVYGYSEDTH